jgi:hypothetical protein
MLYSHIFNSSFNVHRSEDAIPYILVYLTLPRQLHKLYGATFWDNVQLCTVKYIGNGCRGIF